MKNNKSSFLCDFTNFRQTREKLFLNFAFKRNKMDQQMKEDADVRRVPSKARNK